MKHYFFDMNHGFLHELYFFRIYILHESWLLLFCGFYCRKNLLDHIIQTASCIDCVEVTKDMVSAMDSGEFGTLDWGAAASSLPQAARLSVITSVISAINFFILSPPFSAG
jgi:hypothetical protein